MLHPVRVNAGRTHNPSLLICGTLRVPIWDVGESGHKAGILARRAKTGFRLWLPGRFIGELLQLPVDLFFRQVDADIAGADTLGQVTCQLRIVVFNLPDGVPDSF
jgi:hypothetical protein